MRKNTAHCHYFIAVIIVQNNEQVTGHRQTDYSDAQLYRLHYSHHAGDNRGEFETATSKHIDTPEM